jgi:hypothetical protein
MGFMRFPLGPTLALFAPYFLFPYWRYGPESLGQGGFAGILAAAALLWGCCVAPMHARGPMRLPTGFSPKDAGILAGLFLLFLIAQWPYLSLPLAWKGDEEFHLGRAMVLGEVYRLTMIEHSIALMILLAGAFLASFFLLRRSIGGKIWMVPLLFFLSIFYTLYLPSVPLRHWLIRYPPMTIPFHWIWCNSLLGTSFMEPFARLGSFLAMSASAGAAYLWLRKEGTPPLRAAGAAATLFTLPMIYYHASLLYIEPLLLFWQTLVLSRIWCRKEPWTLPDLYALASLASAGGLIKETAPPFIGCVGIFCAVQLWALGLSFRNRAAHLLRLVAVCLLPSLPYLYLRWQSEIRPHAFRPSNFIHGEVYAQFGHSICHYFTLTAAIGAGVGVILLLRKRSSGGRLACGTFNAAIVAILSTFAYSLFLGGGEEVEMIGLCRATLHFWPVFLVGIAGLLKGAGRAIGSWGAIALLLAGNYGFRPPGPTQRGSWGTTRWEVERHYPIDQVMRQISLRYPGETPVVFFGMGYPYPHLAFYLKKFGMAHPVLGQLQTRELPALSHELRSRGIPHALLVYHQEEGAPSEPDIPEGVSRVQTFELGKRRMILYEMVPLPKPCQTAGC